MDMKEFRSSPFVPKKITPDGFNAIMDYIPGFIWFFGKAFFVVFLLMWIKWTFPRLRIDQILALEWKYLVPISMLNLIIMVLIVVFKLHF